MFKIINAYSFFQIDDLESYRHAFMHFLYTYNANGICLISTEGCNIAICCDEAAMLQLNSLLGHIWPKNYVYNITSSVLMVFRKKKVVIKTEIVKMCLLCTNIQPAIAIEPIEWHSLIQQKDVLIIDTRNTYEYRIGTFKNAVSLDLSTFQEFADKFEQKYGNLDRNTKICMSCTGGIRCEKTTHFLRKKGFENIYQLKGGMLSYLQHYGLSPDSRWQGDLYVFDQRLVLKPDLTPSSYVKCYACGQPVSAQKQTSESGYHPGYSCPDCIDNPQVNRIKFIERTRFRQQQKLKNKHQ